MKTLYEKLEGADRSIFDDAQRTVIREMEAIKDSDTESCVLYLADAVTQIAKLQQFALHNTTMRINDSISSEERELQELNMKCEIEAHNTQNLVRRFGFWPFWPYKRWWVSKWAR